MGQVEDINREEGDIKGLKYSSEKTIGKERERVHLQPQSYFRLNPNHDMLVCEWFESLRNQSIIDDSKETVGKERRLLASRDERCMWASPKFGVFKLSLVPQ